MTHPDSTADRLPPHSVEAEQGVLGCMLLSPSTVIDVCVEKLRAGAKMFYEVRHQHLYTTLLSLHRASKPVDTITVVEALRTLGELDQVGGIAYLAELPDKVPSAANLETYLVILREKYLQRTMMRVLLEQAARVESATENIEDTLARAWAAVTEVTEQETTAAEEHIRDVMKRVINSVEERFSRGSQELRGLPTGPAGNYLDKLVRGLRESYYVVLAGRPGSGKTAKALNIVEHLATDYEWTDPAGAVKKGIPVAIFSIEMDGDCLVERMLFGRAGVDTATFSEGFAKKGFEQKLVAASTQLCKGNIYIDATPAQTIEQIASKARRMARQYGIKLFVLDYVQLVESDGGNGMDRVKEITKISRRIMALKKQLKVPWLVLAQMNRNIETAERERKPVLSDLKDCGALEQDADLVLFTYKTPAKEFKEPNADGISDKDIIEQVAAEQKWGWSEVPYRVDLVIPKNRFGPIGSAQYVFAPNLCRFTCWHQFKVKYGVENLKQGERQRHIPSSPDLDMPPED